MSQGSQLFPYNPIEPQVMHIDLNSCFAMMEQQANPFLRHKPVAVTNRLTRGATIIAASYEAKNKGIGVGTSVEEAKQLEPNILVLETDPPKYIYAHKIFKEVITSYSSDALMKSIDEGLIDFSHSRQLNSRPLSEIGLEIKQRFKEALGEYVTCNVGIAPNRFLAKLAAGLNKPDGLDQIDSSNLEATYRPLSLLKLPGINKRYQARLRAYGILTTLDFLSAPEQLLTKQVFKSINGHLWFMRLRGWEVDNYATRTRTVGKQYVLHEWTSDSHKLAIVLTKMCEMLGRRLRGLGFSAGGLYVGCYMKNRQYWHNRQKFKTRLYSTQEIFEKACYLLEKRPYGAAVKTLFVTSYDLAPAKTTQASLFQTPDMLRWHLTDLVDEVNNRFGEFSIMPGNMVNTGHLVPDKIPFGSTRYF